MSGARSAGPGAGRTRHSVRRQGSQQRIEHGLTAGSIAETLTPIRSSSVYAMRDGPEAVTLRGFSPLALIPDRGDGLFDRISFQRCNRARGPIHDVDVRTSRTPALACVKRLLVPERSFNDQGLPELGRL